MVSLIDIGPLRDQVSLRGQSVETRGVSAFVIFQLLSKSDELRRMFAGKDLVGDLLTNLANQAPLTVAELIAAGVGKQEDGPTIEFAMRELSAGETYDLLKSILGMTFPRGVQSFIDELTALAREGEKRGWAPAMKLQEPSNVASEQDTTSSSAGNTPHDS